MWPCYLDLGTREIRRRAEEALLGLRDCRVCPRDCRVDRTADRRARSSRESGSGSEDRERAHGGRQPVCRTWRRAYVGSFFPHHGEEDCLRGTRGSGTIFFSWCNLRCVFCQNCDVSQEGAGAEVSAEDLAAMMLDLERRGCHNVNFVTPEHVVPQILEALPIAIDRGMRIPLVYNTSGYDSLESLRAMDGIVDIYLPDFKFWDPAMAKRYTKAEDYPEAARRAIREMHRQVGALVQDPATGLARRGLIVRHLVMPGGTAGTREIMRFLAREVSPETYVNIMGQYRPEHRASLYPEIDRRPFAEEMEEAFRAAREEGITRFDERWERPRGLKLLRSIDA
jgi:putative pyruvate formate lyase activating enzyme